MDEPDKASAETLISTRLYNMKTLLNMEHVVPYNVQYFGFSSSWFPRDLLQVKAMLGSLLCQRERPCVAVMFWFRCLLSVSLHLRVLPVEIVPKGDC